MAKQRVCDLAKELGISSKDLLALCTELGISAASANKNLEDDQIESIKKSFSGKGEEKKPMPKEEVKEEVKKEVKKEIKEEMKEEAKEEKAAPAKKKKIILMTDGNAHPSSGNTNQKFNNNNNQGGNRVQTMQSGRPIPNKPIRPLTPPSPTPSVNFVANPNKGQENRKPVQNKPVNPQNENKPRENAVNNTNSKPQGNPFGERKEQSERPQQKVIYASTPDPRRQNDRNQGRDNNNRGQGNFQQGQRNNYNNNGQGGQRNNQSGQGKQGGFQGGRDGKNFQQGGNGSDNRFQKNRPSGGNSFVAEAAPVENNNKRNDNRRLDKDKKNKKDHIYEEEDVILKNKNKAGRFIKPEKKPEVEEEQIKVITVPDTIIIKDLADKMKIQAAAIIKKLFLQGKMVTVNQEISFEEAEEIAIEYEIICEKEEKVDVIAELLKEEEEDENLLKKRPPVICVMGHVDHGKTSLLDAIRKTNVTDREAGGITQAIGAYTVNINDQTITFLDTPGHEAFTAMRMRGANSTDIAVLVVAADDGVMPQTVEAINHAKAAGIEIIVAVNKIDKPGANIDRVKQELTEYELIPVDWGGTTEFVPVSAKTGEGIETLLETIILTADILELKANPNRKARGLVVEAELDKGRGPVATVLVQKGTLHVGDFISAGSCHGKVRAMVDDKGRRVKEATPSTPVEILGLNDVPNAGEIFIAHVNEKEAKNFAETFIAQNKEKLLEETKAKMSLDDLFSQIKAGNLKELNLIIKADVQGSVEAVKTSLLKLSNEEVVVKVIHGGVGAINESDVILASASSAIIIGFNVRPDAQAKATAEREGVDVRLYKVIYQAIEDIEAAMKGMLDPVFEEKVIGHAEVRQIFKASSIGNIAGSYVLDGKFERDCKIRITREGEQIYEGQLSSLKRFKDDVKEVKEGFECGLVFDAFDKMQEFDIVEAYVMVEVPR